jgi:prepilin-type N-terminal cleavage/methylation domain-containing protein
MNDRGFTLLELMVVVAVVGILSGLGLPAFTENKRQAFVAATAQDLRNFSSAFYAYLADDENFPIDVPHGVIPAGMEELLLADVFTVETRLGGNYNWEGPNFYDYAGISITNHTAPVEDFERLDRMLDDGNLSTGRFRITPNGRYTYILEE